MTHVLIFAPLYFRYSLIVSGPFNISTNLLAWSRDHFFGLWSLFMLDFFTMSHLFGSLTPPVVHSKDQNFQVKHFRYQTFNETRNPWTMTHASPLKSKFPIFKKFQNSKKSYLTTFNTCFQ